MDSSAPSLVFVGEKLCLVSLDNNENEKIGLEIVEDSRVSNVESEGDFYSFTVNGLNENGDNSEYRFISHDSHYCQQIQSSLSNQISLAFKNPSQIQISNNEKLKTNSKSNNRNHHIQSKSRSQIVVTSASPRGEGKNNLNKQTSSISSSSSPTSSSSPISSSSPLLPSPLPASRVSTGGGSASPIPPGPPSALSLVQHLQMQKKARLKKLYEQKKLSSQQSTPIGTLSQRSSFSQLSQQGSFSQQLTPQGSFNQRDQDIDNDNNKDNNNNNNSNNKEEKKILQSSSTLKTLQQVSQALQQQQQQKGQLSHSSSSYYYSPAAFPAPDIALRPSSPTQFYQIINQNQMELSEEQKKKIMRLRLKQRISAAGGVPPVIPLVDNNKNDKNSEKTTATTTSSTASTATKTGAVVVTAAKTPEKISPASTPTTPTTPISSATGTTTTGTTTPTIRNTVPIPPKPTTPRPPPTSTPPPPTTTTTPLPRMQSLTPAMPVTMILPGHHSLQKPAPELSLSENNVIKSSPRKKEMLYQQDSIKSNNSDSSIGSSDINNSRSGSSTRPPGVNPINLSSILEETDTEESGGINSANINSANVNSVNNNNSYTNKSNNLKNSTRGSSNSIQEKPVKTENKRPLSSRLRTQSQRVDSPSAPHLKNISNLNQSDNRFANRRSLKIPGIGDKIKELTSEKNSYLNCLSSEEMDLMKDSQEYSEEIVENLTKSFLAQWSTQPIKQGETPTKTIETDRTINNKTTTSTSSLSPMNLENETIISNNNNGDNDGDMSNDNKTNGNIFATPPSIIPNGTNHKKNGGSGGKNGGSVGGSGGSGGSGTSVVSTGSHMVTLPSELTSGDSQDELGKLEKKRLSVKEFNDLFPPTVPAANPQAQPKSLYALRAAVLNEIYQTEQDYVEFLKVLVELYMRPLESGQLTLKEKKKYFLVRAKSYISRDPTDAIKKDIGLMFPSVDKILEIHSTKFLPSLQKLVRKANEDSARVSAAVTSRSHRIVASTSVTAISPKKILAQRPSHNVVRPGSGGSGISGSGVSTGSPTAQRNHSSGSGLHNPHNRGSLTSRFPTPRSARIATIGFLGGSATETSGNHASLTKIKPLEEEEGALENDPVQWEVEALAKFFTNNAHLLERYQEFVNGFDCAAQTILKHSNSEFFVEVQKAAMEDKRSKGQNIQSLMIMPIQRITRYHLFIQQLMKFTPEGTARENLAIAYQQMLTVSKLVNECKQRHESAAKSKKGLTKMMTARK